MLCVLLMNFDKCINLCSPCPSKIEAVTPAPSPQQLLTWLFSPAVESRGLSCWSLALCSVYCFAFHRGAWHGSVAQPVWSWAVLYLLWRGGLVGGTPVLGVEVTFSRACFLKNKYKRLELYFSSLSFGDTDPLQGKWKPGLLITQLIC